MPTGPSGHDSASSDFCDVCGMRIDGAAAPAPSAASIPSAGAPAAGSPAPPVPSAEPCPQCGAGRTGQFCEVCGFDFASGKGQRPAPASPAPASPAPASPAPADAAAAGGPGAGGATAGSAATGSAGPDAAAIEFPGYCPERRFRLSGREMRIGRRSVSRGLEPEIDLTGPPADPGVSHLHAVLIAEPDGTWAVLDPGSANGTVVNEGE